MSHEQAIDAESIRSRSGLTADVTSSIDDQTATDPSGPPRIWANPARLMFIGYAAFFLVQAPVIAVYLRGLWARPHYQFFPFVFGFIGWRFYQEYQNRGELPSFRPSVWANICLVASIPFLSFHLLVFDTDFASLGIYLVATSLLLRLGYRDGTRFGLLALQLLIIVRPPFNFDTRLIASLQRTTSHLVGHVLDALGIIHFQMGNVIRLPTRMEPLMVEEACSGVQGLFTLMFIALVWSATNSRGGAHTALLWGSSILWALFSNLLRVSSICLADYWFGVDLVAEPQHAALGYVCLAVSAALIVGTDQLFIAVRRWLRSRGWWTERTRYWPDWSTRRWANAGSAVDWEPHRWGGVLIVGLAVIGVPPVAVVGPGSMIAEALGEESVVQIPMDSFSNTVETFSTEFSQWDITERDTEERDRSSIWGSYSTSWRLVPKSEGDVACHLSCDYPFTDWHELSGCYRGNGWKINQDDWGRRIVFPQDDAGGLQDSEWPIVAVDLVQQTGARAFLLFCLFDVEGQPVNPPGGDAPTMNVGERLKLLLKRRWQNEYGPKSASYQIQAFVSASSPLSDIQKRELIDAFRTMRQQIRDQHLASGESKNPK